MDYISVEEAAKKWGVVKRRVQFYCANNKIPGAINMGKQWIIPVDADRPVDGRCKTAKTLQAKIPYHFPVFYYSRFFSARKSLSEDESRLLDAQVLHIQGVPAESMGLCREIIKSAASGAVRFGAYYTMAFNAMMLGLYSEMKSALKAMEDICEKESLYHEDYKFLLATVHFHISFDVARLKEIDVLKLSPESLDMFQMMTLMSMVVDDSAESDKAIKVYEAFCKKLELEGMFPALVVTHSVLSLICLKNGDIEASRRHDEEACRIAVENKWITFLVKSSVLNYSRIVKVLEKKYPKLVPELDECNEQYIRSWQYINNAETGRENYGKVFPGDAALMVLVSYKLSNKDIASALGISVNAVEKHIKTLCEKLQLNSKAELSAYSRYMLGGN